ncbi:hypothetical protein AWZ03_004928 [Drosophila navojoa]|uniref:Uncharacterized protein n=1 Tax=Drosophila navojoa TaxID=7232 RepID=A0A484BII0_DRONA|nr:hypothetical protein AWZ03_004928 [Drosophila navojoa]
MPYATGSRLGLVWFCSRCWVVGLSACLLRCCALLPHAACGRQRSAGQIAAEAAEAVAEVEAVAEAAVAAPAANEVIKLRTPGDPNDHNVLCDIPTVWTSDNVNMQPHVAAFE